jgi:hypothetical protein
MLFIDDADRVGLGAVALDYVGWAAEFADFDLDGRLDLFAANGSTIEDEQRRERLVPQRPLVFWNGGAGRGFFETARAWGPAWQVPRSFRGGAAADMDGDDDADVVLGALDGAPAILVNQGPPRGRPLRVDLRAAGPNVFGIGARVTVTCGALTLSRELRSNPAYASGGPPEILFGLGRERTPARVEVRWPDGTTSDVVAAPDVPRLTVRKP